MFSALRNAHRLRQRFFPVFASIISQRLIPLPDGSGRTALREYLAFTPEIREALLDTPPEQLIQKTEGASFRLMDKKNAGRGVLAFQAGKISRNIIWPFWPKRKSKENENGKMNGTLSIQ